jgi:TolB-like protein
MARHGGGGDGILIRGPLSSQPPTTEEAEIIRAHLAEVLASPQFERGLQKAGPFLRYVVERALEGDDAALDEAAIGTALFGTESSHLFGETVPMVARRVRAGLKRYYSAGGRNTPLRIAFPRNSYAPAFGKPVSAALRFTLRSVVAVAVLAAAVGLVWAVRVATATHLAFDSVAVMRFANIGGLPATEAVGDGLVARLASDLQRFKELQVTSPQTVANTTGAPPNYPEIASHLSVDALLRSAVYPMDNGVGIIAQLIDGRSGHVLWWEIYPTNGRQLPAVAADISYAVARAAGVRIDR